MQRRFDWALRAAGQRTALAVLSNTRPGGFEVDHSELSRIRLYMLKQGINFPGYLIN
jgi:hypothetical protein